MIMLRMIAGRRLARTEAFERAPSGGPFPAQSPFRPGTRPLEFVISQLCLQPSTSAQWQISERRAESAHAPHEKSGPWAPLPVRQNSGGSVAAEARLSPLGPARPDTLLLGGQRNRSQHSWPQASSSRPFRRAPSNGINPLLQFRMVRRHVLDRERLVGETHIHHRAGCPSAADRFMRRPSPRTNTLLPEASVNSSTNSRTCALRPRQLFQRFQIQFDIEVARIAR